MYVVTAYSYDDLEYTVVATFMGESSHIKSMAVTQLIIEKEEITVNIDDVSKVVGEKDPEDPDKAGDTTKAEGTET